MEFLKRHYEKLILSTVLVVLAVAVILLPFLIRREGLSREVFAC